MNLIFKILVIWTQKDDAVGVNYNKILFETITKKRRIDANHFYKEYLGFN